MSKNPEDEKLESDLRDVDKALQSGMAVTDQNERHENVHIGQIAYEAYFEYSGGKSLISGAPLPSWDAQHPSIQEAWKAAAIAVANRCLPTNPPDHLPSEEND